ncbi:MAG: oligosaccharide flippase family protein [Nitrospirae bacterium]|nr:oligosaccharide flippase family protein [Nitrospirota bacterium]
MKILHAQFSPKFCADSFWSLVGNLASASVGLVAVKIVTSLVGADEYGQASLVLGVLALLNGLLVGPLMTVHLRVYFDYLKCGMASWYASTFNWVLGIAGGIALFIYLLVALAERSRGGSVYFQLVIPAAVLILVQPFMSATTNYLEAHRLQRRLAMTNIFLKGFYPLGLVLLLGMAMPGADAVILSQGLAILIVLVVSRSPSGQRDLNERPVDTWKELSSLKNSFTSFGWALPLGYLVHWVLSTGDRYLIEHFMTLRDVGIYAMNYGFWSLPYLMLNGWLEVLTRPLLYDKASVNDWQGVKRVLLWRTACGFLGSVLGTVTLCFAGETIAALMLGNSYWIGWQVMMCIATAHCFYVAGYSILPLFLASKRPRGILVATAVAAVSNVLINIVAVPAYGMLGAAFSTLVSYVIWAVTIALGAHWLMRGLLRPVPVLASGVNL